MFFSTSLKERDVGSVSFLSFTGDIMDKTDKTDIFQVRVKSRWRKLMPVEKRLLTGDDVTRIPRSVVKAATKRLVTLGLMQREGEAVMVTSRGWNLAAGDQLVDLGRPDGLVDTYPFRS